MLRLPRGARILAFTLVAAVGLVAPWGCGARSGIPTPDVPSNTFCGRASYSSGFGGLSILVLLDQSDSMASDGKWDSASAAIAAFVDDPLTAGIGMGVQYFPLPHGGECDEAQYASPAAPIQLLPSNAAAIKASLASHGPGGGTPTLPALRGALEYARASLIADPTREVIVVLATDGEPNECDSDAASVSAAAADGLDAEPQVLTAVLGIEFANAVTLAKIAAAGGTGTPIPIGAGPGAAQQFVNALQSIRDAQQTCSFTIPPTPGATPAATDVEVIYVASPGAPGSALPLVGGLAGCGSGFYVNDPNQPTAVLLCPGTCQQARAAGGSSVTVSAGCGRGSPPPGTSIADGGASCGGSVDFTCVPQCGSSAVQVPVCADGLWTCAPGLVSTTTCTQCAAVPHGCCKSDGTLGDASCLNGVWECPPGAQLFGQGACKPPTVCASTLPCSLSQVCQVPDATCGLSSVPGSCQPLPTNCPSGAPPACGCNGQTYPGACEARAAGVDVAAGGNCPAPAGTFACGPLFCRVADQICQKVDDFSKTIAPNSYACLAKPAGCPTGCGCNLCPSCPAGQKCSESCNADPGTGGALLTCDEI